MLTTLFFIFSPRENSRREKMILQIIQLSCLKIPAELMSGRVGEDRNSRRAQDKMFEEQETQCQF